MSAMCVYGDVRTYVDTLGSLGEKVWTEFLVGSLRVVCPAALEEWLDWSWLVLLLMVDGG